MTPVRLPRRLVGASLVIALAVAGSCSRGSAGVSADDAVARLEREFGSGGLSRGVEKYYAGLYGEGFDADEVRFTNLPEVGMVLVLADDRGFERDDIARFVKTAEEIAPTEGADPRVYVSRGIAVVSLQTVSADDGERITAAIEDDE
jgi:hypothetical protein